MLALVRSLVLVSLPLMLAPSLLCAGGDDDGIFRYVGPSGHPVFVNGRSRVPLRYLKQAHRVDLSRVSLNSELAAGLRAEVDREYLRLHPQPRSGHGFKLWMARLWDEHSAVLTIAGLLLVLLITAPVINRHVGGQRWTRVVLLLIPALGIVGLVVYAATQTNRLVGRGSADVANKINQAAPPADPESDQEKADRLRDLEEVRRLLGEKGTGRGTER